MLTSADNSGSGRLPRELGVFGATLVGLGAMVGTGVFVSIGVAAGAAGPAVVLAIALAALVAACNASSSAQLAASHAVSGGTYEYGYRYLNHWLGFAAGWMFLCAKSASAATAALGFAGYFGRLIGLDPAAAKTALAVGAVVLLTALVLLGIRRSSRMNALIVSVTLASLALFVAAGLPNLLDEGGANLLPLLPAAGEEGLRGFLYGTALMFVAFTGYARIATLGEEVKEPRKSIPRAIVVTLLLTAALYVSVAAVALGAMGAERLAAVTASAATPLEAAARGLGLPRLAVVVAVGSVTAMLGVLLNLILGLSRVALAMGRQGDLPPAFARLTRGDVPSAAVLGVGVVVALLASTGDVETTWAFSAFTVLIYYAITNLAALRLPARERLYPRSIAVAGFAACLFLAFWVPPGTWLTGCALLAVGLGWHVLARRRWGKGSRRMPP
ncbi:MAG TPA: APC family permease [Gammaproteobacteria bacterium]